MAWPYRHRDLPSWPDPCTLCEELCCHGHQVRWVHSCSRKINPKVPHSILEWVGRRQQSSISTIHPHGKKQNPSPVQGEHSQEPLTPAGQTWGHNRVRLLISWHNSSRDTKLHQTERCWALQTKLRHMNLMGFFPAFSYSLQYSIVTHNTREYNCCTDYLQPLH